MGSVEDDPGLESVEKVDREGGDHGLERIERIGREGD